MRRLPLFLAAILLVTLILPARADTVDSYDISNADSYIVTVFAEGNLDGQCFRPAATAILSSAGLAMRNIGAQRGTWQFRIYSTTGTYGTTCTTSSLLASSAEFDGNIVPAAAGMITRTFTGSNQIVLEANTAYALVLRLNSFAPSPCCSSGSSLALGYDTISPTHAGNRIGDSTQDVAFIVSGTTSSTPGQTVQCYGNCGTAVNTNSTASTNFNSSITLFYTAQSNINGFVQNVTTLVAKSYTNGLVMYLGLYTVERACTGGGGQPFSATCPGFLIRQGSFPNPAKGTVALTMSVAVTSGQWVGIAVSASFNGLHLNDTNTAATMYQAAGIMPGIISQYTTLGARNTYLRAFIGGFTPGAGGGDTGLPCTSIVCGLVSLTDALGGGVFGGLFAFGIIFAIISVPLLYMTRIHDDRGNIKGFMLPMEILAIFALVLLFAFSAVGVLPVWIPILVIALVAWLFTESLMGKRKNQGIS